MANAFLICRGVINGKAGKAAALPKFSAMLSPRVFNPISIKGADYAHPLALSHLKIVMITPALIEVNVQDCFILKAVFLLDSTDEQQHTVI